MHGGAELEEGRLSKGVTELGQHSLKCVDGGCVASRCRQAYFLTLRGQSDWQERSVPWTAARSSFSRKVRPMEEGGPQQPSCAHSHLPAAEKLVEVKLQDVKHRLCSLCGAEGPSTIAEGLFLRSQEAVAAV